MRAEIAEGVVLRVERIEAVCVALALSLDEQLFLDGIGSERRRREWLAWHSIVKSELGSDVVVAYDSLGAPVVRSAKGLVAQHDCEPKVAISVTHSAGMVAVMFVWGDKRCGVDMECVERNFFRVADRYINARENALSDCSHPLFKAAVWCAKEAWYKFAACQGVDFLNDMTVERTALKEFDSKQCNQSEQMCETAILNGTLYGQELPEAHIVLIDNMILCWTVGQQAICRPT